MADRILKAKDAKRLAELRQVRGAGGVLSTEDRAELERLEAEARDAATARAQAQVEPAKGVSDGNPEAGRHPQG